MLFKETCVRRGLKTCIHFLVVGVSETHKRRIMRVVPPECTVLQCGVNRFERTTRYLFMNLFFFYLLDLAVVEGNYPCRK